MQLWARLKRACCVERLKKNVGSQFRLTQSRDVLLLSEKVLFLHNVGPLIGTLL